MGAAVPAGVATWRATRDRARAAVVLAAIAAAALAAARAIALASRCLSAARRRLLGGARATAIASRDGLALGALWVALPCVCLLWLARDGPNGRATLLWILAIVWATDIGAYASAGRSAARGSRRAGARARPGPGLLGGVVCAGARRLGHRAHVLGISPALPLVLLSAGLAIVEQFGDLAESVAKRRFGVKDSSGLIPGHGGLLDRLDGLLAVIPVVALLTVDRRPQRCDMAMNAPGRRAERTATADDGRVA